MASDSCGGRKLMPGRDGWWGDTKEWWGAKIFSVSDHRYNNSQGTGFTQAHSVEGMYPLRSQSQTLCPYGLPSAQQDFFSTVVGHLQEWDFLLPRRVEYLPLNFLQGNVGSKVLEDPSCPWIIIICRIRALAAFSFTQILEAGVKIENTY